MDFVLPRTLDKIDNDAVVRDVYQPRARTLRVTGCQSDQMNSWSQQRHYLSYPMLWAVQNPPAFIETINLLTYYLMGLVAWNKKCIVLYC